LISHGNVKINGHAVTEMGYDVQASDTVEVNGFIITPSNKNIYIVINKPKGYITTTNDEFNRPTVMELVVDIEERVFPVGRLDGDTTGLLIMTNDGDFAYRLTHPSHQVKKTYRARVAGMLSDKKLNQLRRGVDIGGFTTSPADVTVVKQTERSAIVEISIIEGKNRQIRKMFDSIGNKVVDLERISIGTLRLGNLKTGHYRKLSKDELASLDD
jgi:23S rRNA pseudouridine2605 synthase